MSLDLGTQTDFQQSADWTDLMEEIELIWNDTLEKTKHKQITDKQFLIDLTEACGYDAERFIDRKIRKHAAKHVAPDSFKIKPDQSTSKEQTTFLRTILKPSHQRVLVLRRVIDDRALAFWRDHPTAKKLTERFVTILILMYGKEKVKEHSEDFLLILSRFHEIFDDSMASQLSPWETEDFEAWKTVLSLSSSVGDFCPNLCGRHHADLFSNDGCTYNEQRTQEEKTEFNNWKSQYAKSKKAGSNLPAYPHSKFQKDFICAQTISFIGEKEEVPFCKMCQAVGDTECLSELKTFFEKKDWVSCKAFLDKHTKFQIAMFVGLLVDCA